MSHDARNPTPAAGGTATPAKGRLGPLQPPVRGRGRADGRHAVRGPAATAVESFGDYFSWPAVRLFGLLYVVGVAHGHVMTAVLLGLVGWSLMGPTQAIMAMSVAAMLKFANPVVASFSPYGAVLFWLIAMVASVRLYLAARRVPAAFVLLLTFALVALLTSVAASKAVDVSVMKVVSFFLISSAMLLASGSLKAEDIAGLQRWFFSVALVMAVLSILTIPFPSVSFGKAAGLMQGMFNHPQAAGVFFVPFTAWLITRLFVEPFRVVLRWVVVLAVLFAGLIVASGSRTAMFATFVSVGLALMIVLVKGRTGPGTRPRGAIVGFTVVLVVLALGLLVSGVLKDEVESFVLKGDDEESIEEAFESSRGAGMAKQIENFLDAPLTGHGFGVYREGVRGGERHVKRFFGIPVSASAEKGVVFTSVLEEVGIVGALLFYGLLISIIAAAANGPSPGVLAMVIAAIAVNFGEAIIFSTNGMGLFMWLIIGFGLAKARVDAPGAKPPREPVRKALARSGGKNMAPLPPS